MLRMDTATLPPMIATRPSVCMVVCIALRSAVTDGLASVIGARHRFDGHRVGYDVLHHVTDRRQQ